LRLKPVIAWLLALSMAVFPMSMARAAVMGGHAHAATEAGHHGHDHGAATPSDHHGDHHDHAAAAHADASADTAMADEASHASGAPSCCHMACQVFQVSVAPAVSTALGSAHVIQVAADEQVRGERATRIDRPPRPA
jgi:hypothetical protein